MSRQNSTKAVILEALDSDDWRLKLQSLLTKHEPKGVLNPLFSALLNKSPQVKWHAVSGFGMVVPLMAEESREKSRVVIRRFMWMLNEESGGVGWGIPEAMAEVLANHRKLAEDYSSILLSYIHDAEGPDNFIDFPLLLEGAVWGAARLAQAHPDLAEKAAPDLEKLLSDPSPATSGLSCLALGLLKYAPALKALKRLSENESQLELYWNEKLTGVTVGQLARDAVADLERS